MSKARAVWHTQTYHFPPFPQLSRAYPLFESAADAVAAIHEDRDQESVRAEKLPGWTTYFYAQYIARGTLPDYAKTQLLYRGQSQPRWPLKPSLYRGLKARSWQELNAGAMARHDQCAQVTATIFDRPDIERLLPGAHQLSDLQKEAVARHHGAPSELVDLTCEPEVAAVFATREPGPSTIGVIYAINLPQLLSISGVSTCSPVPGGYQAEAIPSGVTKVSVLVPDPPHPPREEIFPFSFSDEARDEARMTFSVLGVPGVRRINAQRGVFLSMVGKDPGGAGMQLWHIIDLITQKYFFLHKTVPYTPTNSAFREEHLLPPDDPIAHLLEG